MPEAWCTSPIGFIRITEEDGFITSAYLLDGEHDVKPAETPVLQKAIEQLDEYFRGERLTFDLPLRRHGSEFQQKVWDQLLKIDYGKTISYARQSHLMNNPLGIRAIASANGKNPIVIIIPCHRVIGSDGNLTGFACGVWRKKWLLEHEAKTLGIGQTMLGF